MAQLERPPREHLRSRTAVPEPAVAPVVRIRPLTAATLEQHGARLTVPTYDRAALVPAVVHLSVGGFSRAHQLTYFDDVAERRISGEWGVVGVGLRHRLMQEALAPQDNLYTVVERSPDGERARVVGVLTDYLFAPDAPAAVLDRLADPRTRVVTMTITDAGYLLDPRTGFTPDDDVRHDLAQRGAPRTVFGFLVEALDRRRRAGDAPFTVLSCDNLHRNGDATRTAVVGFAALRDEVLARWIADRVAFPSSMVDRITPQTAPEERAALARRYGIDDRWPVVTEPFAQWVIEDTFCNGRPPLDQVGVRYVRDVTGHELMKTRLLNATHSALGYLGTTGSTCSWATRCSPRTPAPSWTTRSPRSSAAPRASTSPSTRPRCCCASPTRRSPTGCPGCAAAARPSCHSTCCPPCARRWPRTARTRC
jgi:fructuronate reductase/mannitol 2-dehydrogenase